jgi:uncharacterized protein (TIGR03435 family)
MRLHPTHLFLAATLASTSIVAQTPIQPMVPTAHPNFAVATIKPHDPSDPHSGINVVGHRLVLLNQSIPSLLSFAYSLHQRQIAGVPDSLSHDGYDIDGTIDTPGDPSLHQMQEMIQHLLADRFALTFHREQRVLPVYAIVIAKGGPKLKPAANPAAEPDQQGHGHGHYQTMTYTSASISDFILGEQYFEDRPLVDQTRLTGRYDFVLNVDRNDAQSTDPNAPPGIFTAVQEQLGLKLQPTKAPVAVFVIDKVNHPSAN